MITKRFLGAGGQGNTNIANLFSSTTWTGNATTSRSITTGIDLSAHEGMFWAARRDVNAGVPLVTTLMGSGSYMQTNVTSLPVTDAESLQSFDATGVTVGSASIFNVSGGSFIGWSFSKAQEFFDVLEYTGNETARTIAHSLNAVPGCIIVKSQSGADAAADRWWVYHRAANGGTTPEQYALAVDGGGRFADALPYWNNTAPTDTVFSVGADAQANATGDTYTALLFGHDTTDDGVIQCGGYMGNGSTTGPTVTLGWEPQWLMVKKENQTGDFTVWDSTRSPSNPRAVAQQVSDDKTEVSQSVDFNATGFQLKSTNSEVNQVGDEYIYIAIRAEG